ncbi:putative aminopeptidase NPEPL1 [Porphyridium purpureum]|uniref:Putative aminopeptidase NPEPL1 n=1 Tax=Porphyridium purpureum TaxID=35688 RepID=A0A5J4Z6Y2_PORPP|nr:putative aminopeptidase NPEPL1 [Porphyridium purpureum]|eukprot:POR0047..scf295_1
MIGKFLRLPHTNGIHLEFACDSRGDRKAKYIVVIGRRSALYSYSLTERIPHLAQALAAAEDSETCITQVIPGTQRRLSIRVLPTACSRHNSDSRPDIVCDFIARQVRNLPRGFTLEVHLVLEDPQQAFATGLAVAKGLPLYSRKSIHKQPMDPAHMSQVTVSFAYASRPDLKVTELVDVDAIEAVADGTRLAAYLVDAPCNEMHTELFVQQCRVLVRALGGEENYVYLRVLKGDEVAEAGMNLLYHVGKAAEHPSQLVVLTYAPPEARAPRSLCMVGKGIVFDTGGTCLKTTEGMRGMKRDMGGAAAVLGAFQSIVRKRHTRHIVHAVLCLAENQISEKATRIDDILVAYSGKTVEVNNTDAEGRLVVADGVAYACAMLNPETIVDVATLTGSQAIATGRRIAALYCNDESLEIATVLAGRTSGDLCHPLPYVPEFWRDLLVSDVADMKNAASRRDNCPSACAAQFIEEHLAADYTGTWMHIDMAGPSSLGERGTGYGVGLLSEVISRVDSGIGFAVLPSAPLNAGAGVASVNVNLENQSTTTMNAGTGAVNGSTNNLSGGAVAKTSSGGGMMKNVSTMGQTSLEQEQQQHQFKPSVQGPKQLPGWNASASGTAATAAANGGAAADRGAMAQQRASAAPLMWQLANAASSLPLQTSPPAPNVNHSHISHKRPWSPENAISGVGHVFNAAAKASTDLKRSRRHSDAAVLDDMAKSNSSNANTNSAPENTARLES